MKAFKLLSALTGSVVVSAIAWGFGGEDIAQGNPWHHENITYRALTGNEAPYDNPPVKFGTAAAEAIAWHADYIDSYLYNPVFWAEGAVDAFKAEEGEYQTSPYKRTKAALVGFKDLAKLHFDDTFSNRGLQENWERYAMGTLIGLVWASELPEEEGIAAGHHILGVSFHAVQDFYSHSNWESDRHHRCLTYFETPKDVRDGLTLFSGAYEEQMSNAPAHHGAYSLSCSVLRGKNMDPVLGSLCGGISPIQNTSMCDKFRACSGAGQVIARLEDPITDGQTTIWTNPPGIALDNTALARAQAPNRNLTGADGQFLDGRDGLHFPEDRCSTIVASEGGTVCQDNVDGDLVFAGAKDLAMRATMEWADYLETQMNRLGKGAYWDRLKANGSGKPARFEQFEDFSKLPYQFLAAGEYPIGNPRRNLDEPISAARGWFLRVRIKTADTEFAGTDANIRAIVTTESGPLEPILLDYLPTNDKQGRTNNRLLVYNDFEQGDDDVYTIGPISERPISIALKNESAGFTDVLDALATDFVNSVSETLEDVGLFFRGLIGGEPDLVGSRNMNLTAAQLKDRLASGEFRESMEVNGGDEGHHAVHFTVRGQPSALTQRQREDGWVAAQVQLTKLRTIKESVVDRLSTADEPFVIFHIAPLGDDKSQSHTYLSPPFDDMDDGEEEPFPSNSQTRATIKLPPEGILVLSTVIYESDDDTAEDRRILKTNFVTGMDRATQRPAREFLNTLGAAVLEDWDVESIEVYAFHRSAHSLAGTVLRETRVGEIEGGETSQAFELDWSNLTDFAAAGVEPVLSLESPMPDARAVLEGTWHSEDYRCGEEIPYVGVEIGLKEDGATRDIIAVKTSAEGDECVNETPGEEGQTFRGHFEDGVLTGERFIRPPPEHRPMKPDPENEPLDRIPDYDDPAIHPQLGLEGNWFVTWIGSDDPPAMLSLYKGGSHACHDYSEGCWYHFSRDPDADWSGHFYRPTAGSYIGGLDEVTVSANGAISVDWPYGVLGHWGGESTLQASGNVVSGSWSYGNDGANVGSEVWVKIKSNVTEVEALNGEDRELRPVGEPVTLRTEWVPETHYMRGNRSDVKLNVYGNNLWGIQHVFMPRYSDLEVGSVRYICEWADESEYRLHNNWKVCMDQGGVRGLEISLNVWWKATTGPHEIFVNGEAIPFNLVVENEPPREPEWQPMKMEFQSCSVLREVERDWNDQPFTLVRQDFRPRGERD